MNMEPRWDRSNQRWECSLGSGKNRTWFRSKVQGEDGRKLVLEKRRAFLEGPPPLAPGSIEWFIETYWWPHVKAECTESTIRGYRYVVGGVGPNGKEIKGRFDRFWGRQLNQIRLDLLQRWVDDMRAEQHRGQPLSAKRVVGVFSVMSDILQLASLLRMYDWQDHRLAVLPEIEQTVREDLFISKVRAIEEAATGTDMEGPVWTGGYLGLRRNEVCGLKVPHIEIHGETATITIQDNRQPHGETNKLKSKRRGHVKKITVPRWMGEKLLSFAEPGALYVFSHKGKPIHPDWITKGMGELCEKAGVEPAWDFRTLRAACRSNLKHSGAEEVDTMRVLGHSSVKTSRGYQDRRPDEEAALFERMMNS